MELRTDGLQLLGAPDCTSKPEAAARPQRVTLVTIPQEIKEALTKRREVQIIGGKTPSLRLGDKTFSITLMPEQYHHELYTAGTDKENTALQFSGLVTSTGTIEAMKKLEQAADAAEEALKRSLAMLQQEKEKNKSTFSSSLLPSTRKSAQRFSRTASSLIGNGNGNLTPSSSPLPTPQPSASKSSTAAKAAVLKRLTLHLLAVAPLSAAQLAAQLHCRPLELEGVLARYARKGENADVWVLENKAFKELDIWAFPYQSESERESAVENAVRAFDRTRVSASDKLWQRLLPVNKRGRGICLSRLNIGAARAQGAEPKERETLNSGVEEGGETESEVLTGGEVERKKKEKDKARSDMARRLFSKNPARAAEMANKKKRAREGEAGGGEESDAKRVKKTTTTTKAKQNAPAAKIKSAEFIDSDDEEDIELRSDDSPTKPRPMGKKTTASPALKPANKPSVLEKLAKKEAKASAAARTPAIDAKAAAPPPQPKRPAPPPSSKYKAALNHSPSNSPRLGAGSPPGGRKDATATRPGVPSPLGASRPITASSLSVDGRPRANTVGAVSPLAREGVNGTTKGTTEGPTKDTTKGGKGAAMRPRSDTLGAGVVGGKRKVDAALVEEGDRERERKRRAEEASVESSASGSSTGKASTKGSTEGSTEGAIKSEGTPKGTPKGHTEAVAGLDVVAPGRESSSRTPSPPSPEAGRLTFRQALDLAERFKAYFPPYRALFIKVQALQADLALSEASEEEGTVKGTTNGATNGTTKGLRYRELEKEVRAEKERLASMHKRLQEMKRDIWEAWRGLEGSES